MAGTDKNHVFLNNPVHDKPFIKLENGTYFSAITFLFPHLGLDILEHFINTDHKLKQLYSSEKGKYLETRVEQLFTEAFPSAQIYPGSLWKGQHDDKLYENDLLVVIGEFAIVVEAKSGTVSPPAKRGAPDRLFDTLKQLVAAPSEQAIRFQRFLTEK